MAVGLRANAAGGIDEQDGDIAIGSRDRHVAGVLLMPRCVGDEDASSVGQVHVPVGHVDGDALLTLGFQAVGQQREVDLADRDRGTTTPGRSCVFELVDRNRIGFGKQSTDQRGLAIVDRTAGN
jgi:hypothetical protein